MNLEKNENSEVREKIECAKTVYYMNSGKLITCRWLYLYMKRSLTD